MKSRNELLRCHLKHLLFLDSMMTHHMGMNHNAMDRSCVYDRFVDEIQSPDFNMLYDDTLRKYWKARDEFTPEPVHIEHRPCIKHPQTGKPHPIPESCIKMGVEYEEMDVEVVGGYWESLQDVDEYVESRATHETVSLLMKKIYET